jgi:HlyD family secretion protein
MKGQRWLLIAVFLLLVLAAITYGFMPRPLLVETARVTRGPLQVTLDAEGKTRVQDRYVISAPVAGIAQRIELDVGDRVHRGQVLAWLAPLRSRILDIRSRAQAQAQLAAAEAALRMAREDAQAARAAADYARAERERLQRLQPGGVVSQDRLEQAQSEARRSEAGQRAAESAVDVARFKLEAARSELSYSAARDTSGADTSERVTITTPVDAQVLKVHQRSEYVVEPGRPLLEIGDPHALEVEIDVLSADAVRIRPGTPVLFERWGGGEDLQGEVRVVEPAGFTKISALGVEEQRVLVIADIVSPAELWQRLGDGYRVDARFIIEQSTDVLRVPSSALLYDREGWAIYAVEDGRARFKKLTIGRRSGLLAEVVSGLEENESVIIRPGDSISDGVAVRPRSGETR